MRSSRPIEGRAVVEDAAPQCGHFMRLSTRRGIGKSRPRVHTSVTQSASKAAPCTRERTSSPSALRNDNTRSADTEVVRFAEDPADGAILGGQVAALRTGAKRRRPESVRKLPGRFGQG